MDLKDFEAHAAQFVRNIGEKFAAEAQNAMSRLRSELHMKAEAEELAVKEAVEFLTSRGYTVTPPAVDTATATASSTEA